MAVAYQSFAEAKATGASASPSKPSGTVANDLLVMVAAVSRFVAGPTSPVVPSGWTQVHWTECGLAPTGAHYIWTAWKVAGGSEPASYTFSWTGNCYCYIALMRISGEDTSSPIDVSSSVSTGTGTSVTCPSVTTTVDDCLVLAMMSHNANTNVDTGYDGSTTGITVDNQSSRSAGAEYYAQASAGATGTKAFTATGSGSVWGAVQIAIAPAAAASGGLGWRLAGERASLAGPGGLAG